MVYIHGTDRGLSPALVSAHYDSVSTSYGLHSSRKDKIEQSLWIDIP